MLRRHFRILLNRLLLCLGLKQAKIIVLFEMRKRREDKIKESKNLCIQESTKSS